jgi:PHD/YefM family antitoxin component YafN of YafNO toxin-antitoxin module
MKTQFVTDNSGKKIAVILSIKEYKKMMDELDELEDIKLYDEVKRKKESSMPVEKYLKQRQRRKNGSL